MKCFRWRLADNCGPNHDTLRCSLSHLEEKDQTILVNAQSSSATFLSPGFDEIAEDSVYGKRNLCIYNISLDCADNLVELVPSSRTTSLSDAETCRDYLSFHVDSQRAPLMQLCGQDVADQTKYRDIHSSSFYGVLWSNHNSSKGRFEVTAKCKDLPGQGSGDDGAATFF